MTDALTRALFTGRSLVLIEPGAENLPIDPTRIPWLVGALDGSEIHVTKDECSFIFEVTHPWLDGPMVRVLWQDEDTGQLTYMANEMFYLLPEHQGRGYGARSCAIEVTEVARLGIQYLGCQTAGHFGSDTIGYYVWPALGFDAELEDADIALLPNHLRRCTTLNELFLAEGGAEHWLTYGGAKYVSFRLERDSTSWAILTAYLQENGIEL
ncbi:hypothetical protein POK33_39165 [Burkholderia cenocepacia]|uniref:hypothetical protein n=1 Tax=Burkholderia cenocepacia TaxID=95486 RepID=UPI0023BA2B32|nr:hypothetical protein [Burkholderia cenocepacia]MDF0506776.1 hypothetical protein [Burkholderia cenocepacia]